MDATYNHFSAFNTFLEGVQVIDPQYAYLYLNQSVLDQANQTLEALIGKKMWEAFPGIETTEMFSYLKACMESNSPHTMENEFDFPDGSKGYFELRMQRVPEGVLIMSLDVTEKKRFEIELQEINERYIHATNVTSDAVLDWNLSTNKILYNDQFNEFFVTNSEVNTMSGNNWIAKIHPDDASNYLNRVPEFDPKKKNTYEIEYRAIGFNGQYKYFREKGVVIPDKNNKPCRVVASLQEISSEINDRIRNRILIDIKNSFSTDLDLQNSIELVLHSFFTNYPDIRLCEIWLLDQKRENLELFSKDILLKNGEKFYEKPDSINKFAVSEGIPGIVSQQNRILFIEDVQKDPRFLRQKEAGKIGLVSVCGIPLRNNHEVIGTLLLGSDQPFNSSQIGSFFEEVAAVLGSEIKRKILESELSTIFEHSPNILGLVDFNGQFLKVNSRVHDLLGYSATETLQMFFFDLMHPEHENNIQDKWQDLIDGKAAYSQLEFLSKTKFGKKIWLNVRFVIDHVDRTINFVAQDVTKEKILKDLFDTANRLAGIGYWKINPESNTIVISDIAREILQINSEEELEFKLSDPVFSHWNSGSTLSKYIERSKNNEQPWDLEVPVKIGNSLEKWLRITGQSKTNNGELKRINGSIQDISDRKMAELELKRSEQRYFSLFQLSPIPMWVYDLETLQYVQVNKNAIQHYGYSEEEFLSMTLLDLRPSGEHSRIHLANKAIKKGTKGPYFGRYIHRKKDGSLINVDIYGSQIKIGEKNFGLVIGIDVTDKIHFENNLTRSIIETQENERKEVGQELHDNICQLLAYCQLNLEMVKETVQPDQERWLKQAQEGLNKCITEVRNLSHRYIPSFHEGVYFSKTLADLFEKQNIGNRDQLQFNIDDKSKMLQLNEQLHLNLYRIAQEQWRNIDKYAKAKKVVVDLKLHRTELEMSISDDGVGFEIDQKTEGIGIRNMKRRAEMFNGQMTVEAAPQKGCKITIKVPVQ